MSKDKKDIKVFSEHIINENLDKLIGDKFGKYSKYIIQERALPDLRDGLKPVQRRILFAMNELKLSHLSSYKKSARIVGDVIGKYHPHGDTSVYEAMVRLSQDWKLNIPLIDMHGNKGSIDGDGPAAMRYTETRLAKISQYLLTNISKSLTPFAPNFDDSELEPVVLPALFPNLIINGATGIAAGYATNIPPHNLNEVINALIYVLENREDIKLSQITKFIKGPDFPTGGSVQSKKSIKEAYATGKGKLIIRSKIIYDQKNKEFLITEIPFETNKSEIVKNIDEIIRAGKLPGLKEVRDDSDRTGLQVTISTKNDINIEATLNYLYKNTDLQKNYSVNMVSIKDKKPQLLGLMDILLSFANFQLEIYTKLFKYELNKNQSRQEIIDGLVIAVKNIDRVIKEIRQSKNKSDAKVRLVSVLKITDNQAEAIVNLRLYRLSSTDIDDLINENKDVLKLIDHYKKGLNQQDYLVSHIVSQLQQISKEFQIPRRTIVEDEIEEIVIDEKALLQEENVHLVITHAGYIKKVSIKSKETSAEDTLGIREDDVVLSSFEVSNMKTLCLFSSSGRYFTIPIYKIEEFKWKEIGEHIGKYFTVMGNEEIVNVAVVENFQYQGKIVVATQNGFIKQINVNELILTTTKKGGKYINLKSEDKVVATKLYCQGDYDVISITKNWKAIRYDLSTVPILGLVAAGVKNMNLEENDIITSISIDTKKTIVSDSSQIILFTDNGKAKRIKVSEIKETSRAGKGITLLKQVKSNPHFLINFFNLKDIDKLNLLTSEKEHISILPKKDILLTTVDTGLTNITKNGIVLVYNQTELYFDVCSKI